MLKADSVLNGNYDYSYFDYAQMKGMVNNIPLQQDAAGGMLMYCCVLIISLAIHVICNIVRVLSKPCLPRKKAVFTIPFYHSEFIRQPILNAVEGANYDVAKLLDWVFDGCKSPAGRTGWGIIVGKWGDYDVSGLQGSITDGGGYAFLMNSIKPAWLSFRW